MLAFFHSNISSESSGQGPSSSTLGRLFFLAAISLVLCASFLMSVLTPLPIVLAILIYGRTKGWLVTLLTLALIFFLGQKVFEGTWLFWTYLISSFFALIVAEIILHKIPPLKGLICSGLALVILCASAIGILSLKLDGGISGHLTKKMEVISKEFKRKDLQNWGLQDEDAKNLNELLTHPEEMSKEILKSMPFTIFIGIFFTLWVNIALTLRSFNLYAEKVRYPYTLNELLAFKTPEILIWPLILVLLLMLVGPYWWPEGSMIVGKNLLFCMGIFYFFHGLGIFVELLNLLRIEGTFRSLLIMLTVITSYWILALIGLFDMWVDFRKFFKKKMGKGKDSNGDKGRYNKDKDEDDKDDDDDFRDKNKK